MEIKGILNRICGGGVHKKVPVLESMEQDRNKKEILRKLDIFLSKNVLPDLYFVLFGIVPGIQGTSYSYYM